MVGRQDISRTFSSSRGQGWPSSPTIPSSSVSSTQPASPLSTNANNNNNNISPRAAAVGAVGFTEVTKPIHENQIAEKLDTTKEVEFRYVWSTSDANHSTTIIQQSGVIERSRKSEDGHISSEPLSSISFGRKFMQRRFGLLFGATGGAKQGGSVTEDVNVVQRKSRHEFKQIEHEDGNLIDGYDAPFQARPRINEEQLNEVLSPNNKEASGLRSQRTEKCNSHIRVCLYPDTNQRGRLQTASVPSSNQPFFDTKLSLKINDGDQAILISAWNQLEKEGLSEFLGCMNFAVSDFQQKKQISGWYFLLNEMSGHRKNVAAFSPERPPMSRSPNNTASVAVPTMMNSIPETNEVVRNMTSREVRITRGSKGFGFTVSGSCPVFVNKVERKSLANDADLRSGDYIVKIDGINVSRSTNESVIRLIKHSHKQVVLVLARSDANFTVSPSPHRFAKLTTTGVSPVPPPYSVGNLPPKPGSNQQIVANLLLGSQDSNHLRLSGHSMVIKSPSMPNPKQVISVATQNQLPRDTRSYDDLTTSTPSGSPVYNCTTKSVPSRASTLHFNVQLPGNQQNSSFQRYSAHLLLSESFTLIEGANAFSAQVYLFSDMLLITKAESDAVIVVFREPVYTNKITQSIVSTTHSNELLIQYFSQSGSLQTVRLRANSEKTLKEWNACIQYNISHTYII